MVALMGEELLQWLNVNSQGWRQHLETHPELLAVPCDIRETNTVAQLLQHIVAVELRYAERLCELPLSTYESIPYHSAEVLYQVHDRAMGMLRPLLTRDGEYWEEMLEMPTRSAGTLHATRRTVLVHLATHSMRHYAQLATIARHHGAAVNWPMDYILMPRAE